MNRAIIILILILPLLVAVAFRWRVAARRGHDLDCENNLLAIGLALHTYHDSYNAFPSPDAGGHSWRIRILPFLFASPMYEHYRYDEPWNGENNLTLTDRLLPSKLPGEPPRAYGMPFAYRCPQPDEPPHRTAYLMLVGENAFGKPNGYRVKSEITDSFECTLVVAETISRQVHWLEPRDFEFETMSLAINDPNGHSISSMHGSGPAVVFADGAVFRISPDIDPDTLRALITINGGEDVDREELVAQNILRPY